MDKRAFELIKTIAESARDNEQMAKSILGKAIVDCASQLYNEMKDQPEPVEVKVTTFVAEYVVDRDNEEDTKYEGLKEIRTFEEIGKQIMRSGHFKRSSVCVTGNEEHIVYHVKVVNQK